MPTLSIIIPTLNEEKAIKDTILQFKKGMPCGFELIVSDGGSTDRTMEVVRETGVHKLVTFPKGRKQTIAGNRNNGAMAATGEFLVFCDSGALLHEPEKFMKQALEEFKNNPNLVALTVSVKVSPHVANFMDKAVFGAMNIAFTVLNNGFNRGTAQGKFQMVRRELFLKVNGYREDLPASEDTDLFYRLSRLGRVRINPKLTIYHGSRRAHALGWPKLLFIWYIDAASLFFFNKVVSKEWKVIR